MPLLVNMNNLLLKSRHHTGSHQLASLAVSSLLPLCKFSAEFAGAHQLDMCNSTNSAIHKATSRRPERPQRPFPYSRLQGFSGIVPGKAGNGSAGGFVNSAVNHFQYPRKKLCPCDLESYLPVLELEFRNCF